jgi:hypothetical protein
MQLKPTHEETVAALPWNKLKVLPAASEALATEASMSLL